MHQTITGVDLAKDEIQVVATKHIKVHSNKAMTRNTGSKSITRNERRFWFRCSGTCYKRPC